MNYKHENVGFADDYYWSFSVLGWPDDDTYDFVESGGPGAWWRPELSQSRWHGCKAGIPEGAPWSRAYFYPVGTLFCPVCYEVLRTYDGIFFD